MNKLIKIKLASFLGRWLFELLFYLNKVEIKGEHYLNNLIQLKLPIMVCVWHGRLAFPSWYLRLKTTNVHAIASNHFDAEIMAQILNQWGYSLIRGSTKKGGKAVINQMSKVFKDNGIIAVTSDGPKGPARIAKPGSTALAIKYNVNIITITGSASKYWQFNSWDKFILPKPFGKIQIVISSPLELSKKLKTTEEEVNYLSNYMNNIQDQADELISK